MSTAIPVQKELIISPSNFFDPKEMRKEFDALNAFIFDSFKVSLYFDHYENLGMYLCPRIEEKYGFFKDSKLTEGGWIKGVKFEDLMYKLCAMIIGEGCINIVTKDWKNLYTINYLIDSKKLITSWHFHSEAGYRNKGLPTCRSCGALWPVT